MTELEKDLSGAMDAVEKATGDRPNVIYFGKGVKIPKRLLTRLGLHKGNIYEQAPEGIVYLTQKEMNDE
jgi:hypothetical protein